MQLTRKHLFGVIADAATVMVATAAVAWIGAASASAQALPAEGVDKFITVNGLKLHYLDWGNEAAAVHHAPRHPRTAHTFDHVARRYQKDYHVLAIDMRGHGDSEWDPAAHFGRRLQWRYRGLRPVAS